MEPENKCLTMEAGNQTFILPLDDVDIDLLPNYFKTKEEAVPIWSSHNLYSRRKSFYEFQVLAERDGGCKLEEIKTIPCHICNIDVPTIYLKEHHNSSKHIACSQIAEQALERAKRQMFEHYETTKNNKKSIYYCESCSSAVKLEEKQIHETTKEHLNSVKYDTLLNELLIIYKGNGDGLNLKVDFNTPKIDASTNTNNEDSTSDLRKYVEEITSMFKTDHSLTAIDNKIMITIRGKRVKVSLQNFHGFYLSGDEVRCLLCDMEVGDEKKHVSDGAHLQKIMAPFKDLHCIREIDSIVHCVICNKITDSTHLSDSEHYLKLDDALTSSNGPSEQNYCDLCEMVLPISQVPHSLAHTNSHEHRFSLYKTNPNFYHHLIKKGDPEATICKICFSVVDDRDTHLQSDLHKRRYKALLDLNKMKKIDEFKTFCQICCTRLLVLDEFTHIKGRKHQGNIQEFQKTGLMSDSLYSQELNRLQFKTNLIETENEYYLNTDGILNFQIDDNSYEMYDDETLTIYKTLTEELNDNNNLINLKLTDGNLMLVLTNTGEDLDDIKESITLKNKKPIQRPFTDFTKVYYMMEKTDEPATLICKLCQIRVPNTAEDINYHNKSEAHAKNFSKCIDRVMVSKKKGETEENLMLVLTNTGEVLDDIKESITLKNKKPVHRLFTDFTNAYYLMEKTDEPNTLICKVCQIRVLNTAEDINDHNKSEAHAKNFSKCIGSVIGSKKKGNNEKIMQTVISDGKIEINSKTCTVPESETCGSIIPSSRFEMNLQSCSYSTPSDSNMPINLPSSESILVSRLSRASTSDSNTPVNLPESILGPISQLTRSSSSDSNLSSKIPSSSKSTIKIYKKDIIMIDGEEFTFCDICLISVPNNERCLKIHYEGAAHKHHAQNAECRNAVVLTNTQNPNELLCKACHVKVPNTYKNTIEHLKGSYHEVNYSAMLEKNKLTKVDGLTFFCGFCKISVAFSGVVDHITKGYHSLFVKSDIQGHVLKSAQNTTHNGTNANQAAQKPFHFCDICKVKVPNSDHNINIHEKGQPHMKNMKLKILQLEASSTLSQDALKQNYTVELTKTGELHCKVCKVNVSNNINCFNIHTKGAPHKQAYNLLLATHKITKIGNNLHCQACNVFLKQATELTHIENMSHLLKLLANNGVTVNGGVEVRVSASQPVLKGKRTRTRTRKNKQQI